MTTKDDKIISTALERFRRCEEAESENRQRALEDLRFSLGEQWDEAIRRARENDPEGARPCLTVDKLDQYIRQVVNDARQNKPSIKPRPKDDGADVETADVLAGLIRHIEDQSSADIAYDTAVEMAARAGFGFIRVVTDYAGDDTPEQDIFIRPVINPFSCHLDPDHISPDGSDARFGFAFEDMPRAVFESTYPKADPCDFERSGPELGQWLTKDTVRICEYFEVVEESTNMLQLADGTSLAESEYWEQYAGQDERPEPKATRARKTRKVIWRKMTAKEVLETRDWPGQYIPIVPVYAHLINVAGERRIAGLIRPAKDAQRMYNYAASAFVERVALTPKAPFIGTATQFEGYEDRWAAANVSNQAYLPYNADPSAPPPQRQSAADIPAGWMQVMQGMEHDIQGALGMYNAALGAPSNEKSGRAILARQREADIATFHIIDNLSRGIRQVGRIIVDLIPKIYDTRRVVRILGDDGSQEFAQINPEMQASKVEKRDPMTGKVVKIYNPGVGRYDVTVTVGPAYSTKRQEAAEFLTQVVQSSPDMMPIIGDLMFRSLDLPHAEEIAERLKKLAPPQIQEQDENAPQIPPQVQQQMQMMSQQMQAMQEQLSAAAAELGDKRMEYEGKTAEFRLKERELAIKEFEAETKRLQVTAPALSPEQVQAVVMDTLAQLATPPQEMAAPGGPPMPPQMMTEPPQGGFFSPEQMPPEFAPDVNGPLMPGEPQQEFPQ